MYNTMMRKIKTNSNLDNSVIKQCIFFHVFDRNIYCACALVYNTLQLSFFFFLFFSFLSEFLDGQPKVL